MLLLCYFLIFTSCEEGSELAIEQPPALVTYIYNGERFYEKVSNLDRGVFENEDIKNLLFNSEELYIKIIQEEENTFAIFDNFDEIKREFGVTNNPFDLAIDPQTNSEESSNSRQEIFSARLTLFPSYNYQPYDKRVKINANSNFIHEEGQIIDVDLANVKDDVNFRNRASSYKYYVNPSSCDFCTDWIVTQILDIETGRKTNFFHKAGESLEVANLSWVGFTTTLTL